MSTTIKEKNKPMVYKLAAMAVAIGGGYGLIRAARRSNTQVHRINQ